MSSKYVNESFATMRFIVGVGWSIYLLGYLFGHFLDAVDDDTLILIYNSFRIISISVTVPLQMFQFYLILFAVKPDIERQTFLRFLFGTVARLAFGYSGEAKFINPFGTFLLGLCGWGLILHEVFLGEAGKICADGIADKYVKQSSATMRFIGSVGWSIYLLGYLFGHLLDPIDDDTLNLIHISLRVISNSVVVSTTTSLPSQRYCRALIASSDSCILPDPLCSGMLVRAWKRTSLVRLAIFHDQCGEVGSEMAEGKDGDEGCGDEF